MSARHPVVAPRASTAGSRASIMVLSPFFAFDISKSVSYPQRNMALNSSSLMSARSGAPSARPSKSVVQSGTALPPLMVITAMETAFISPRMVPSSPESSTAFPRAFMIFSMVMPWSASPKRESMSVSSSLAAVTDAAPPSSMLFICRRVTVTFSTSPSGILNKNLIMPPEAFYIGQ